MTPRRYVKEFEGLRGILAVWVTLGHSFVALPVGSNSYFGSLMNVNAVTVFITLSGFVIFTLLGNRRDTTFLQYIVARFFRIFPVYLIVLIISTLSLHLARYVLLSTPSGTATAGRLSLLNAALQHPFLHFIVHLTMLQGLVPNAVLPSSALTLVGQAWSISVEWQFYLIAPLLFAWLAKIKDLRSIVMLVCVTALCLIYRRYTGTGFFGNSLVPFALGFASYYFYQSNFELLSIGKIRLAFFLVFCVGLALMRVHALGFAVWGIVFYAVISARRSIAGANFITRLLLVAPIAYIGRISYSLYMVHMQIVFLLLWLFHALHIPRTISYVAFPLCCLICALGVASAMHHLVEAPFHEYGRRLSTSLKRRIVTPMEKLVDGV